MRELPNAVNRKRAGPGFVVVRSKAGRARPEKRGPAKRLQTKPDLNHITGTPLALGSDTASR
jgi:hypothetical protein